VVARRRVRHSERVEVIRPRRTVVLVEGESDRVAVTTLARCNGRDLAAEGVDVVAMGGATNVHRFLARYADPSAGFRVAGLCDLGERRFFARAARRHGLSPWPLPAEPTARRAEEHAELSTYGFFVCERDLEDELIRCLGADRVVEVVADQGEAGALATFRQQPAQRMRPVEAQLHRFLGTHSGRKAQYAQALVEALPVGVSPPPLARLLAHV
jgi:hypothetical protein